MILLRWLPFLAKFGGLAAIPVIGPALSIVGAGFGLLVSFVRWLFKDIEDAFREPQRLAVRMVCLLAVLAFGVYEGIKWDAHKVAAARAEVAQMKQDWRAKDEEDARKADAAKKAREEAEAAARAASPAPTAAPVVRKRKPAAAAKSQPSVFSGFPSLFGTSK